MENSNKYLRSYSSITLLINYFKQIKLPELASKHTSQKGSAEELETLFKCLVGLYSIGYYDLNRIDQFITNRYFQQALEIELLPSSKLLHKNVEKFSKELESLASEANQSISHFSDLKNAANFDDSEYNSRFMEESAQPNNEALMQLHKFTLSCLKIMTSQGLAAELYNPNSLLTDEVKTKLAKDGYAIIENVLSDEETETLRTLVLKIAELESANGTAYTYGGSDKCQRIYNLLNKHSYFRDLIQRPLILEIMEHMFARDTFHEKYTLSSWHCNIIGGGGEASILHVDAAVPEPLPDWMIRVNINYMLDDFKPENGATLCLPGSHKLCRKPTAEDQNRPDLVPIVAPKGSLAIWNGHLWHKSGANQTDRQRIALLGCFAASHLREMSLEEDHLRVIDRDIVDEMSPKLKQLIGVGYGVKKGAQQRHSELQT